MRVARFARAQPRCTWRKENKIFRASPNDSMMLMMYDDDDDDDDDGGEDDADDDDDTLCLLTLQEIPLLHRTHNATQTHILRAFLLMCSGAEDPRRSP